MQVYKPIIKSKDEVIGYLSKWSLESGYKFVPITNNGNGLDKFFWKIWHEQKNDPDSELRQCFPNGKIWKNPKDNTWRFYFNNNQEPKKQKRFVCKGGDPNCEQFQEYEDCLKNYDENLMGNLNDPCGCCLSRIP